MHRKLKLATRLGISSTAIRRRAEQTMVDVVQDRAVVVG